MVPPTSKTDYFYIAFLGCPLVAPRRYSFVGFSESISNRKCTYLLEKRGGNLLDYVSVFYVSTHHCRRFSLSLPKVAMMMASLVFFFFLDDDSSNGMWTAS